MTPTHMGMSFAMRARGGGVTYDPWFSNGNTDINHYFGADADELYRTGVPASGTITGSIAGNVLSPVTSPLYQQALTGAAGDPLGAGFDYYSYDSFDAANSTIHDPGGDVALAILLPYTLSRQPSNNTTLIGKYDAVGTKGYEWRYSGNNIYWYVRGTLAESAVIAAPTDYGTFHNALLWYSPTLTDHGIDADTETGINTASTPGDYSNSATFALGSSNSRRAVSCTTGPTVVWMGANAETVIANRVASLVAWRAEL